MYSYKWSHLTFLVIIFTLAVATIYASDDSNITAAPSNETSGCDNSTGTAETNCTEVPTTAVPDSSNTTASTATNTTTPETTTNNTASPGNDTSTDPMATTQQPAENTTSAVATIAELIKSKWVEFVSEANFSGSTLNQTEVKDLDIINVTIEYYKSINDSDLQNLLEPEGIDDKAESILNSKSSLLESEIRDQFNSSQNHSLYAVYAALHWLHDTILVTNGTTFSVLLARYNNESQPNVRNETNSNETTEATPIGFFRFILSNATGAELLEGMCKVADEEGVSDSVCTTSAPPSTTAAPLPSPEKLEETWKDIIEGNYSFLTSTQSQELQAISPDNLTSGLIQYVGNLTDSDVTNLVTSNATRYVSTIIRKDGKNSSEALGDEAYSAFRDSNNRQDVFYLYMNFINNLFTDSQKFESILQSYVNSSSNSTRRRRSTIPCDVVTINAVGLCCYTITTKGVNQTTLRDALCSELQGGQECLISFSLAENESTTSPPCDPVKPGLTTAQIVGIAVGGFVGLALIIFLIIFLWKRSNKKKSKVNPQVRESYSENDDLEMESDRNIQPPPRSNGHTNGSLSQ